MSSSTSNKIGIESLSLFRKLYFWLVWMNIYFRRHLFLYVTMSCRCIIRHWSRRRLKKCKDKQLLYFGLAAPTQFLKIEARFLNIGRATSHRSYTSSISRKKKKLLFLMWCSATIDRESLQMVFNAIWFILRRKNNNQNQTSMLIFTKF